MEILQKTHHLRKYLSCQSTLGKIQLIAYITLNPIFSFLRQFYSEDLANFAGSTIIFFNGALIIQ